MLSYNGEWEIPEHYKNILECCELYLNYISDIYRLIVKKRPDKIIIDKSKIEVNIDTDLNEEYLRSAGFLQEAYEKKLLQYLISDFVVHMQESVKNAKEYKPQVAFILARKPMIDDLYYLQLLLVNAKDAVELIFSECEDKDNFKINDEKISQEALDILMLNTETPNMFYKIRYGENKDGLLTYCNKASHIATARAYKTEPGELNFVFADEVIIKDYIISYSNIIITLLHYVAHLISYIYETQYKDNSMKTFLDFLDIVFFKLLQEGELNNGQA